jgi:hypothetical protein
MPFNVGDILQAKTYTYFQGQLGITSVHYRVTAAAGTETSQLVVAEYDTFQATQYKALITNAALYRGVTLQKIKTTIESLAISITNSGVGTGGATAGPTQVAGLITKRSNLAGRHGRGRVYIPFPDASAFGALTSQPTGAYLTALANLAAKMFVNPYTFFTAPLLQLEPIIANPTVLIVGSWPVITTTTQQPKWATQRRRGDYGRLNVLPF